MIKKLYKSKTLGQTTLVTSGTILNALIGSLFFVTAARLLGPEQWGMLSILTTILVLLSDIFDFGTNSGIVRFVSGALARNDSVQALQAVKFSFKLKLASGIFLSLVGILTASWLAKLLFADERLGYLIFFTLLTTLPSLLYDFVSFTLQAQQKFWQYLAVALSSNLTRLILFIPLFLWLPGVFSALSAIFVGLVGAVILGLFFVNLSFMKVKGENALLAEFFQFNRWIALSFIAAAISSKADIFFLTKFSTLSQVGIYAAANKLAFIFPQIVGSVASVLSPAFARHKEKKAATKFLLKTLYATGAVSIGILILALLSPPVVLALLGSEYYASTGVFQIILIGMSMLTLQIGSTSYITYFLSRPAILSLYGLLQLSLVVVLNLVLVPVYGAVGAALTFVLAQGFLLVLSLLTVVFYHEK